MTEQYLATNINNPRIVRIENEDYQVTLDDSIIAVSAPVAPITLTLPEARTLPGWTVCIKAQDVTGGAITVVGLNGQLIDGAVSTVLSTVLDSVVLESIGDEWIICGGGAGGAATDNCLSVFLVSPNPSFSNYTTIQSAYDAAVAAGGSSTSPSKVLVCPGIYEEDVTMSTPGIDIVAVAIHRENELASDQPGGTILRGQLSIDLSVTPGVGVLNRCQWIGIDIEPNSQAPVFPLLDFTGTTLQYATVSDCQISHTIADPDAIATVTCTALNGPQLNLVRVNIFKNSLVPVDTIVLGVLAGTCNVNDCRIAAQAFGDGFFGTAIFTATLGVLSASRSRFFGLVTGDGSSVFERCSIESTIVDTSAIGSVTFLKCIVSRILGGIWVTGTGSFEYDDLTWTTTGQSNSSISSGVTTTQRGSLPQGQPYLSLPFVTPLFMGGQTSVLADDSGGAKTVTLPSAVAQLGPIRIKGTGGPGPLTVTPVGADTINGAGVPLAVPAAGLTLVSDGAGNWETFG